MDLATPLTQVVEGANAVTSINHLVDALSPAAIFGRNADECVDRTFAWFGGRWGGVEVSNGNSGELTANTTHFMVVNRSTAEVSFSTTATNWNDSDNYARAYQVVTGTSSITDYEDHRAGPGGVYPSGDSGSSGATVANRTGTTYDLLVEDAGRYLRFTNASAKSVNVQNDADEPLPDDFEVHIRNVGAADLTLVEDTSVTINPPAGGSLIVLQGGTVTLKRVAEDEFDLIGATSP